MKYKDPTAQNTQDNDNDAWKNNCASRREKKRTKINEKNGDDFKWWYIDLSNGEVIEQNINVLSTDSKGLGGTAHATTQTSTDFTSSQFLSVICYHFT